MHEETANFSFPCQDCRHEINVSVLDFLENAYSWFRGLDENKQSKITELFACGIREYDGHKLVQSHDSGFPYFGIIACNKCGCDHLLYVSYYEMQPARYIARFQGGAKIDD